MNEYQTMGRQLDSLRSLVRGLVLAERDGIPDEMKPAVRYERKLLGKQLDNVKYEIRRYE